VNDLDGPAIGIRQQLEGFGSRIRGTSKVLYRENGKICVTDGVGLKDVELPFRFIAPLGRIDEIRGTLLFPLSEVTEHQGGYSLEHPDNLQRELIKYYNSAELLSKSLADILYQK
jgi:hypothetical protein